MCELFLYCAPKHWPHFTRKVCWIFKVNTNISRRQKRNVLLHLVDGLNEFRDHWQRWRQHYIWNILTNWNNLVGVGRLVFGFKLVGLFWKIRLLGILASLLENISVVIKKCTKKLRDQDVRLRNTVPIKCNRRNIWSFSLMSASKLVTATDSKKAAVSPSSPSSCWQMSPCD